MSAARIELRYITRLIGGGIFNGKIEYEAWSLNGQRHRENDQPAEIRYDKTCEIEYKAWFLNGQLIKDRPVSM